MGIDELPRTKNQQYSYAAREKTSGAMPATRDSQDVLHKSMLPIKLSRQSRPEQRIDGESLIGELKETRERLGTALKKQINGKSRNFFLQNQEVF